MIQKLTPKKFVTDKDERLVAPNEMILAENVTISERADGSASILKTMKGTGAIPKETSEPTPPSDWTIVGSVSDDQRGRVYFFVYDDSDDSDSRIMMFKKSSGKWSTVFSDDDNYLNFNKDYPVKADILNKAFSQDGVVTTALYFTDNYNPPRKINVDRAIAGDYNETQLNGLSGIDLDYALNTIKAPPRNRPTFAFETDSTVTSNNFKSESFQFSCQYIYRDGEESALSSFSDLATSVYVSSKGLTENASEAINGNVCVVSIPWAPDDRYQDVASVRLVARSGNSDPFFIIDEFDPREDLEKSIAGADIKVFNSDTLEYRFYNESYYPNIASSVSGKLYDNVPQKAMGQSIAGSRLMYSNYTEGYENFDVKSAVTLTVQYGDIASLGGDYVTNVSQVIRYPEAADHSNDPDPNLSATGYTQRGEVRLDLLGGGITWPVSSPTESSVLPDGVKITLRFDYKPGGKYFNNPGVTNNNNGFIEITRTYQDPATLEDAGTIFGTVALYGPPSDDVIEVPDGRVISFSVQYITSGGQTIGEVRDSIIETINDSDITSATSWGEGDTYRFVVDPADVTPFVAGGYTPDLANYPGTAPTISGTARSGGTITSDLGWKATFKLQARDTDGAAVVALAPYMHKFGLVTNNTNTVTVIPPFLSGGGGQVITSGSQIVFRSFNDPFQVGINKTSTSLLTPSPTYVLNSEADINSVSVAPTFKHGSTHDFGIVYFDKWGRSGFVNEVGSVYVKHPAERTALATTNTTDKGPASILAAIDNSLDGTGGDGIPDWAETYQYVYGGSQFSNVFQYTTGGGYIVQEYDTSSTAPSPNPSLAESDHRIYVSLNTLEQHQRGSSSAREYSFTKGDICRIISFRETNGTLVFPRAIDATSGSAAGIMEFEVVGVEFLQNSGSGYQDGEGNPIQAENTDASEFEGQFLVLRAPRVDSGLVKYPKFDWYSLADDEGYSAQQVQYPNQDPPSGGNAWGAEVVIEILTPKKSSDSPVYYEIGERKKLTAPKAAGVSYGYHGPNQTLTNGDVIFRNVSCRTPVVIGGSYNVPDLSFWEDRLIPLECEQPSETEDEKAWSKGRAHVAFDRAATINRYNGITYSEPYADDTSVLSLSSFVPSQANFFDLPSENGACSFLGLQGDNLMAIQENKVSRLSLNKSVLETGSQGGIVALSNKVINNIVSYAGDFGTTNPESVLIRDGVSYFVDVDRRSIVRISDKGLQVISDKDVKSQVSDRLEKWDAASGSKTIVSGYDAEDDIYYATLSPAGTFDGYTIGYDEKGGFWQGTYSFYPDRYATLKNLFLGLKSGGGSVVHLFSDLEESNSFFGADPATSKIRIVSNANPSMVKKYHALSVESKVEWSAKMFDSDGRESKPVSFSKREDAYYGSVEGIVNFRPDDYPGEGVRISNDSKFLAIGTVDSATYDLDSTTNTDSSVITLRNSIRGTHIPVGYDLYVYTPNGSVKIIRPPINPTIGSDFPVVTSVDRNSNTITVEPAATDSAVGNPFTGLNPGTKLFVANSDEGATSQGIRDHYSVVELSFTPVITESYDFDGEEIYAVNTHFSNSPLNDAIGGQ